MNKVLQISAYIIFSLGSVQYAMADQALATQECGGLEDNAHWETADLTALDSAEFPLDINSSLGASFTVYQDQGKTVVIKAGIYGEMGRMTFSFHPDPANIADYFVVVADYTYTAPVTHKSSTVGWISTQNFKLCGGESHVIDMLQSDDALNAYRLAVEILDSVTQKTKP